MAHDVATHIYDLACEEQRREAAATHATSRRLLRFEAYATVQVPAEHDGAAEQVMCEARAPNIVLYMQDGAWHLEFDGTSYNTTAFPDSIPFVLRCAADRVLYGLSDDLIDKGVHDIVAPMEVELCGYARFGGGGAGRRIWSHSFGRVYDFPDTFEDTYESKLHRYLLSLGRQVLAAGRAVTLLARSHNTQPREAA